MRLKLGDQTWGRMPVTLAADQSLRQARGESGPSFTHGGLDIQTASGCMRQPEVACWWAAGVNQIWLLQAGHLSCNMWGIISETMRGSCCVTI